MLSIPCISFHRGQGGVKNCVKKTNSFRRPLQGIGIVQILRLEQPEEVKENEL